MADEKRNTSADDQKREETVLDLTVEHAKLGNG